MFFSFYSPQLLHPNGSLFRSLPSSFFFFYHLKSLTMTKKKKRISSTSPIISLFLIRIVTTPHNELRRFQRLRLWIPTVKAQIWVGFAMFLGLGLVLGFLCICVLVGLAFWLWVCLMVGFCVAVGGVYGGQFWVCRWWWWWSWVWVWVLSSQSRVTRVRKKKKEKENLTLWLVGSTCWS